MNPSSSPPAFFNLLDEPWIPVLPLDGPPERVGLLDIFRRAAGIRDLDPPNPLARVALMRLLLAIVLHRTRPQNHRDCARLRRDGLPFGEIIAYLETQRENFYLFHPSRPFYQNPELKDKDGTGSPITRLTVELSSGSNKQLFDHSADDHPPVIPFGEAAVALLTAQSWSLGGGISGFGRPRLTHAPAVGAAHVTLLGGCLAHTLHLNLVANSSTRTQERGRPLCIEGDIPCWEREKPWNREGEVPVGLVDWLTWPARYALLVPLPGEAPSMFLGVREVMFTQGHGLGPGLGTNPWTPLRSDPNRGWIPLGIEEDRAAWRHAHAWFARFREGSDTRPSEALRALMDGEDLDSVRLLVGGLASDQGKALLWREEHFALAGHLAARPDIDTSLHEAIQRADAVAKAISSALAEFARFALTGGGRDPDPKRRRDIVESIARLDHYWGALEPAFHQFLDRMATDRDDAVLVFWPETLRRAALDAFEASIQSLDRSPRHLRAATEARRHFRFELRKAIPTPGAVS